MTSLSDGTITLLSARKKNQPPRIIFCSVEMHRKKMQHWLSGHDQPVTCYTWGSGGRAPCDKVHNKIVLFVTHSFNISYNTTVICWQFLCCLSVAISQQLHVLPRVNIPPTIYLRYSDLVRKKST